MMSSEPDSYLAYMGGGDEIFEDEEPRYRNYIKEILRPREDV